MSHYEVVVPVDEVKKFVTKCMVAVGTKEEHACDLAELLAVADYRGHFSHGLNRLDMYIKDIQSQTTVSSEPVILNETPATAYVDGRNGVGPTVGRFCIDLAIKKAKEVGIGWVVAKDSNHFGIAGWYSMRATEQGLIGMAFTNTSPIVVPTRAKLGMAFTNTSPLVVPTRAKKPILGTNPIAMSAPAQDGDSFVLDMATSTVALGKVEYQDRKGEKMPLSWGVDSNGKVSSDPKDVLNGGGLLHVGGPEISGGYKGYGLGMMVEIFCGVLAGANFGPHVRNWKTTDQIAHLGQCFVAINPDVFAPGFKDRMSTLISDCRGTEPAEGEKEVLVAGDPERQHMAKCDESGGIPYHPNLVKHMNTVAEGLGVEPLKVI